MTTVEIKTNHGQSFTVQLEAYDAQAIATKINDRTGNEQMVAIGNVVLNRNGIMSVAPVTEEAAQ